MCVPLMWFLLVETQLKRQPVISICTVRWIFDWRLFRSCSPSPSLHSTLLYSALMMSFKHDLLPVLILHSSKLFLFLYDLILIPFHAFLLFPPHSFPLILTHSYHFSFTFRIHLFFCYFPLYTFLSLCLFSFFAIFLFVIAPFLFLASAITSVSYTVLSF